MNKDGIGSGLSSASPERLGMVSLSCLSRGMMGNSDSICSVAHAVLGGGFGSVGEKRGRGGGGSLVSFDKWWERGGVLMSPIAHTPYRRTQPPPPGDREREHRKEMGEGGGVKNRRHNHVGDKTQGKTGVRYWRRETCVLHVSGVRLTGRILDGGVWNPTHRLGGF